MTEIPTVSLPDGKRSSSSSCCRTALVFLIALWGAIQLLVSFVEVGSGEVVSRNVYGGLLFISAVEALALAYVLWNK